MSDTPISGIELRPVINSDLDVFFAQQSDANAIHMAAFTRRDSTNQDTFMTHWTRCLADVSMMLRTIVFDGRIAGSVASFVDDHLGHPEVTYWIGREFWGRGIATAALFQFLKIQTHRPLYGRTARDNVASLRVLEKCAFRIVRYEKGFANARGREIEEAVLVLE